MTKTKALKLLNNLANSAISPLNLFPFYVNTCKLIITFYEIAHNDLIQE